LAEIFRKGEPFQKQSKDRKMIRTNPISYNGHENAFASFQNPNSQLNGFPSQSNQNFFMGGPAGF